MSKARAKTIKLLLQDGSLNGVINMADSSWNSGKLYSAPRASVDELIKLDICKHYGVYLLLSEDMVYIGQASDLSKRIKQHKVGKDWWDRVILLTTDNDSLDKSAIDYLEATLIDLAESVGRLDSENHKKGNKKKVDEFRETELEQYLEEALFLLELLGITVFSKRKEQSPKTKDKITIETGDKNLTAEDRQIRAKREAVRFIRDNGFNVSKRHNYATLNGETNMYWLNPRVECLEDDWDIILNNQNEGIMTIIHIPAKLLKVSAKKSSGLFVRKDKPFYLDLNLDSSTLIDKRSGIDFSQFNRDSIKY